MPNTDATIARINSGLRQLGPDEVAVVDAVIGRLLLGRAQYGQLNLAADKRDWRKEASEEALDLAVYMSCSLLSAKR